MLHGESFYDAPTHNYIAFIQESKIYVAHSLTAVPRQLTIDRLIAPGTDVAITFKTEFIGGPNRRILHRTVGNPQIFHVTSGNLYYRDGIDGTPQQLATDVNYVTAIYGWVDIIGQTEDQGIVVAYSSGLKVYITSYNGNTWSEPVLFYTAESTINRLKIQRTSDYRLSIMVYTSTGKKMLLTNRASIMGATQDNDKFSIAGKQIVNMLSVKQPSNILCRLMNNNEVLVKFDAPIIALNKTSANIRLVINDVSISCVINIEQLDSTSLLLTTDYNLEYCDAQVQLVITSSTDLQTPGGTTVNSLSAVCNTSGVAKYAPESITPDNINNTLGGE